MRAIKWAQATLLLLLPTLLLAQNPELKRERTFAGEGLYGYMNGGAELYLEYGVCSLVTRDVVYGSEDFTIEVYQMPSPEDAFGIYSQHIYKCARADENGCVDCLSPYQLQAVVGNCYISVVFPSGSEAARKLADGVLHHYVAPEADGGLTIPSQLALTPPYSGRVKYIRGPIALSSASLSLSKQLEGIKYSGIWFVGGKPAEGYKALVFFSDNTELERLRGQIATTDLLQHGSTFLYIKGKEAEREQAPGGFGF